jgi:hypothetical protein
MPPGMPGGGTVSWGREVCLGGNQAASSKSPGVGPKCSQSEGVPGPKADAPVGALVLTKGAGRNTCDPVMATGPEPWEPSGGCSGRLLCGVGAFCGIFGGGGGTPLAGCLVVYGGGEG